MKGTLKKGNHHHKVAHHYVAVEEAFYRTDNDHAKADIHRLCTSSVGATLSRCAPGHEPEEEDVGGGGKVRAPGRGGRQVAEEEGCDGRLEQARCHHAPARANAVCAGYEPSHNVCHCARRKQRLHNARGLMINLVCRR